MVVFLLPALVSAALLGLAVSAVVKSQSQAIIISAVYFLAMTLLSGFLYPLEEASLAIRAMSKLFPLTFVHPNLKGWIVGLEAPGLISADWAALWLQCLIFGALLVLAIRHALRNL
jgi:ABC-type multidrug transport system permease subunit